MALHTYMGAAQDGDYTNTVNWKEGVVPILASDVVISKLATYPITKNLNQSAIAYQSFSHEEGCKVKIGSEAAPLQFKIETAKDQITLRGDAECWLDVSATTIGQIEVLTQSAQKYHLLLPAAFPLVMVRKGHFVLESGTATLIEMETAGNLATDARVTNRGGTITKLEQVGGYYKQEEDDIGAGGDTVSHEIWAGEAFIQDGDYQALIQHGGLVRYDADGADGTLDSADIRAGKFDASGDTRAKTITALTYHGMAEIDLDNGAGNITVGTFTQKGIFAPSQGFNIVLTSVPA